uniref:Bifunctional inhibitor/plant lipid transfer protein/seed storage helical domain-containing protein n=1 Tax=Oryza punctata TaxID=4537 RepID=A0A0E0KH94_ORYPU
MAERRHLLALVALLHLAAAAAGVAEAQAPQPTPWEENAVEARCELDTLATQLALHCLPAADVDDGGAPPGGPLNEQCCKTVGYAVHLDAGFRCLCAAAAEPQLVIGGLNSTRLLAFYAACGGRRPVDSRLATACGVMAQTGDMSEAACDPANLADQVARYCRSDAPTAECCEPVVASVDLAGGDPSCLCRVLAEPQTGAGGANNATALLAMYTACGGLRAVGADITDGCIHPRTRSTPSAPVISARRSSP